MTFTSWQFVAFAAAVFALCYLALPRRWKVYMLVLASMIFYGAGQPQLLALLAIAVLGTYGFLVLALENRKVWLPAGIAFNLGLLAFFKYKFLFIDAAATFENAGALELLLKLPLPIGISFFFFHNISLLVDLTRRGGAPPTFPHVFLYIMFFPH